MNPRRRWLAAGAALPTLVWTGALRAQAPTAALRRVGVLVPSTREKEEVILQPFFDQMRELGWIEGQTIAYDRVFGDDLPDRLPALAVQLVARRPELIFAPPSVSAVAAKAATATIPIVFAAANDPVASGLVKNLGRPGGHVTGVSNMTTELTTKRVQLLKEILPGLKRLGVIGDAGDPNTRFEGQMVAAAATTLGIQVVRGEFTQPGDLDAGFAKLVAQRPEAVYVLGGALTTHWRPRFAELAAQKRLPMIPGAISGGLFTYSASLANGLRRSAQMIDKILRGAKPADLPVEQPTVFNLVVNLKAAKALGLTVPSSVLLRADRVIE
jgi:putative tryptophan/tyrosine transport system substrate-binding protein